MIRLSGINWGRFDCIFKATQQGAAEFDTVSNRPTQTDPPKGSDRPGAESDIYDCLALKTRGSCVSKTMFPRSLLLRWPTSANVQKTRNTTVLSCCVVGFLDVGTCGPPYLTLCLHFTAANTTGWVELCKWAQTISGAWAVQPGSLGWRAARRLCGQ